MEKWYLEHLNHWYFYMGSIVVLMAAFLLLSSVAHRYRVNRENRAAKVAMEEKAGQNRARFIEIFAFEPSGMPELWKHEQRQVNSVLEVRALALGQACKAHRNVQEESLDPSLPTFKEQQAKRIAELEKAEEVVAVTKKAFWDSHRLAKSMEFSVWDKFRDYLTNEQRVALLGS